MKLMIDNVKLELLLEKKKKYIGAKVAWDSVFSAASFMISVLFATYDPFFIVPGITFKIIFMVIGLVFTGRTVKGVYDSIKHSYTYEDLLKDINTLNEITHDHSIVVVRDTFEKFSNRFLVYDDLKWGCKLFLNYKDNTNNEAFIIEHLSRELKMDEKKISLEYVAEKLSEKVSGRDGQRKLYSHKLYLAKIREFPPNMLADTFECDGRKYHWMSINDLEEDTVAMEKNEDIISFVKESI